MNSMAWWRKLVISASLLAIGAFVGVVVTVKSQQASLPQSLQAALDLLAPRPAGADFQKLVDVWNEVHTKYVNKNINDGALLQGALTGLVSGLGDPYSTYLSADSAKQFEDEISGTFEGVGMQVGYKDGKVVVIAPLPHSPAEAAGIKAGDMIVSVDGKESSTMTLDEVIAVIRGKQGTNVTIVIQRGSDQPQSLVVTRQKITVDSVTATVTEHHGKKIAEFIISSFNQDTGRLLRSKAAEINAAGLDGIVLDLRNDPGGYLDQAIDVGSVFIPKGTIVSEVDRNGQRKTLEANGHAILSDKKVVVLVNGGSASASEIVAGALQDSGHGTIIGTQTFGKGSVQDYQTLSDGSSLKLTVAKWFTPKGRSISDHGITPDVVVEPSKDTTDSTVDPQRDRALDMLAP